MHFLERANARSPNPKRLSAAAVEHLMGYGFPGNVRELENLVEQAAALSEGEELLPEDFPLRPSARVMAAGPVGTPPVPMAQDASTHNPTLAEAVEDAERRAIAQALERHGTDLGRVAEELAVSSTTLWRKMKRLNLRPPGGEHRE
jgi:two-component system response regulator HydG